MQAVLIRRKTELEQMLHARAARRSKIPIHRAFPSERSSPCATLEQTRKRLTLFWARGRRSDRHIISYQTAIGQALLAMKQAKQAL